MKTTSAKGNDSLCGSPDFTRAVDADVLLALALRGQG
ncbi:hypothetical protein BH11GEM2_BH11GEM2_19060 [soil metagenome]